MVVDIHGGGRMEKSFHLEEERSKISDEKSHHLKHLCQDKTQRKIATHRFTQAKFLYSKYVVIYKRR